MAKKYFGWVGKGGYKNVVIIENHEARVFNIPNQEWETDNEFLKAMWDPGSEFDEITEAMANEILERIKK